MNWPRPIAWRARWPIPPPCCVIRKPMPTGCAPASCCMAHRRSPEVSAQQLGLRPVMTLQSRIIAVQKLRAGENVGYGGFFRAEAPMRVGVVACGYADGYPRHAPTGTPVLVEGSAYTHIGARLDGYAERGFKRVTCCGCGQSCDVVGRRLPVEQVAHAAGTISYELLCALAARVPIVTN